MPSLESIAHPKVCTTWTDAASRAMQLDCQSAESNIETKRPALIRRDSHSRLDWKFQKIFNSASRWRPIATEKPAKGPLLLREKITVKLPPSEE